MGRATSKGNEAKSEMKQPSDMPTMRFEHGWKSGKEVVERSEPHAPELWGKIRVL